MRLHIFLESLLYCIAYTMLIGIHLLLLLIPISRKQNWWKTKSVSADARASGAGYIFVLASNHNFKNKCQWPLERGNALYANTFFAYLLLFISFRSIITWIMNAVRRRDGERQTAEKKHTNELNGEQILSQTAAVRATTIDTLSVFALRIWWALCFENYPRNILRTLLLLLLFGRQRKTKRKR